MKHMRFVSLAAVLVLAVGLFAAPPAEGTDDLGEQKERQKQIQEET